VDPVLTLGLAVCGLHFFVLRLLCTFLTLTVINTTAHIGVEFVLHYGRDNVRNDAYRNASICIVLCAAEYP
jgi:hypothetical protein